MRYIECGIQDKDNAYFFDSSRFDSYCYFIYFDNTEQQIDLAGFMDEGDVDFSYCTQDYVSEFNTNIAPLSNTMFTHLASFDDIYDITTDSTYDASNHELLMRLYRFIDKIDTYNKQATSHDYYDHGIRNVYPFAELVIIKPRGVDFSNYVMSVKLNKFVTKDIGEQGVTYTLQNESVMSRYFIHYSTYESDYTSIYLKLLYNINDYETVNKSTLVVSELLYPSISQDSSLLFFDLSIDCTTADESNRYWLFDLSESELIYVNNKYLCHVKNISDTTNHPVSEDYTFSTIYSIEFLDFDSTDTLDEYMGDTIYNDFTQHLYTYYINIRIIKKLNYVNNFFTDSTGFFKLLFPLKTFFGANNRSNNEAATDWKTFFATPSNLNPITYSGTYDVTNNVRMNVLSLLNSFSSDKYTLPYDATIQKDFITDSTPFTIDLFISNSIDVTNFVTNMVRNGIYIFRESDIADVMTLRLLHSKTINPNTFQLTFVTVNYDDTWSGDITSVYSIPSGSKLIQYKYHIYSVIPYLRLDKFNYNNDVNNLITIHSFAYTVDDPSILQQNGQNINV